MPRRVGVNDKGFWEHKEIVAIHEQLLKEMGYNRDDPGLLPDQWWETERNQYYIEKICRVLESEIGSESLWALKDPRICRLLPLWRQVFSRLGVKPLFLHIVRNPPEVVASLKHRDRLPRPLSLLLWFQHNLEAIQNSAGYPRQFITFPQLLNDGEGWLLNIFQKWGVSIVTKDHAEISVETPFLIVKIMGPTGGMCMSKARVFIIFDLDHDEDLINLLVGQSRSPDSPFEMVDRSVKEPMTGDWKGRVRERIKKIDQMIVICGEHTNAATGVSAELKIAQEEKIPYFLLSGRKDKANKKPVSAKQADKMYKWTWGNLKALISGAR